jgi:chloramphenicol-sensitive protein RarD
VADPISAAESRAATLSAVACFLMWGLMPLMFQAMGRAGISPAEITGHRALWSVFWAGALVLVAYQGRQVLSILRQPKTLGLLTLSALLIGSNWLIFLIAVNHGHTLEASLGYYINPIMNMLAGTLLFRERISRLGWVAVGLAVIGVLFQTLALGHPPIMSLTLALTFCLYSVIRKQVAADAQSGLFVECLILTLPGAAYVAWLQMQGQGHLTTSLSDFTLLLLLGPATVIPLAAFSWSARRIPLSTLSFIQFIGPTVQFGIGLANGEPFTQLRAISFAFIWSGVLVFAYGAWKKTRPLDVQTA